MDPINAGAARPPVMNSSAPPTAAAAPTDVHRVTLSPSDASLFVHDDHDVPPPLPFSFFVFSSAAAAAAADALRVV
jgi:hypothetical protein